VLTKDPSEITVGDIVKAVDEALDLIDCVVDEKSAVRVEQCSARPGWEKANREIKEYLYSVTIADMCKDAEKKGVKKDSNHPFDYNI
jgi:DNA-binding IscR family transcriptional regulator